MIDSSQLRIDRHAGPDTDGRLLLRCRVNKCTGASLDLTAVHAGDDPERVIRAEEERLKADMMRGLYGTSEPQRLLALKWLHVLEPLLGRSQAFSDYVHALAEQRRCHPEELRSRECMALLLTETLHTPIRWDREHQRYTDDGQAIAPASPPAAATPLPGRDLEKLIEEFGPSLPAGFRIRIDVEHWGTDVWLIRPDNSEAAMNDGDSDIREQFLAALRCLADEAEAERYTDDGQAIAPASPPAAATPLPGELPTCVWTSDHSDGCYDSACGESVLFTEEKSPAFRFCPYCGSKIVERPEPEEPGDSHRPR